MFDSLLGKGSLFESANDGASQQKEERAKKAGPLPLSVHTSGEGRKPWLGYLDPGIRRTTPAPSLRLFCTFVVALGNCVRTQSAWIGRTAK